MSVMSSAPTMTIYGRFSEKPGIQLPQMRRDNDHPHPKRANVLSATGGKKWYCKNVAAQVAVWQGNFHW